jgi:VWFA-related protein
VLVRLERMAICLMLPGAVVLGEGLQTPNVPSRVEVVRVDVAVTDTKGRPVPDLSASDFEVREDGTPQTITSFAYVEVGTATSPPAAQPPSGERGILPAAPAPVSPRPRQRRIMAFVVDDLNLSRVSMTRVRDLLERFVEQSLQPDDLVGLFRTGVASSRPAGLGADAAVLLAEIARLSWLGQSGRERAVDPIEVGFAAPVKVGRELDARRAFLLAEASLRSLQSVVAALEPLEGRKTVIFLSDGLKVGRSRGAFDRLQYAASEANRASLVVYTIDPRGVQPLDMDGGDFVTEPGFQEIIRDEMTMREASYELDHDGLERLAEATGGLFLHDTDPGKGLAQALRDQAGYYLLGFAATNGAGASYHRVSVKVRRPGLRVRARTGYWSGR